MLRVHHLARLLPWLLPFNFDPYARVVYEPRWDGHTPIVLVHPPLTHGAPHSPHTPFSLVPARMQRRGSSSGNVAKWASWPALRGNRPDVALRWHHIALPHWLYTIRSQTGGHRMADLW